MVHHKVHLVFEKINVFILPFHLYAVPSGYDGKFWKEGLNMLEVLIVNAKKCSCIDADKFDIPSA